MNRILLLLVCGLAAGGAPAQDAAATRAAGSGAYPTPELKIMALLDAAARNLGGAAERFGPQDAAGENRRVSLGGAEAKRLSDITAEFFRALGSSDNGPALTREHLQRYRANFPGGTAAWQTRHLAIERALMMGRAQITRDLWMETLTEFIRDRPADAVLLVGEVDIGSWVDMKLSGLNFPADIDFSAVTAEVRGNPPDVNVNQEVVDRFERKLKSRTGLSMVDADALLTPHGSASSHVFIGDWGKAYAEMELLKPGVTVKIIDRYPPAEGKTWGEIRLADGKPTLKSQPGPQLFWEIAFATDQPVNFPKLDLSTEPMTTLEMWRHEKHDISQGPFSGAQKLLKVMKYLERSNYVNEKATAAYRSSLPGGDSDLIAFAKAMVDAKGRKAGGAEIERLVGDYTRRTLGEELTASNYGAVVTRIEAKAQIAMIDNSVKAIACRFTQMAAIEDAAARGVELEKFWKDLGQEAQALRENHLPVPEFVEQACALAKRVQDGNLPPEALKARADELKRILEQSYKLEPTDIQRIMNYDAYGALQKYFKEKCKWPDDKISELIGKLRKKYPNASQTYDDIVRFNEDWNQSLEGSKVLGALDFADNALAVYDALLAGRDYPDKALGAVKTMLWLKAAGKLPILGVGASCWEAYQQGNPMPAVKAIAFYYLPTVGAFWGLGEKLQRFDAAASDANFYRNVVLIRDMCRFEKGHLARVMIPGATSDLTLAENSSEEQRAQAFVAYFSGGDEANVFGSGNTAIRYWATLIPREMREYDAGIDRAAAAGGKAGSEPAPATRPKKTGWDWDLAGYGVKMKKLREFFPYSAELGDTTRLLEDVHARPAPTDEFTPRRNEMVEAYENQIETEVWRALFKVLEASADPDIDKMRAELEELERVLSIGDLTLGRDKGITSLIKAELASRRNWMDGGYKFADKFVYTRYLTAYRRVKAIQDELVLLWTKKYGVEWAAITAASPLQMLFGGGTAGAPRLTGSPEKDQSLAEACRAGQLNREQRLIKDVELALRRRVDPETDHDLLTRAAQLEFEIEHLLDACESRRPSGGTAEIRLGITERQKKLDELLNQIRNENLRFLITGKTLYKTGETVNLAAKVEGMSDRNRTKIRIVWSDQLGEGDHVSFKADKAGSRKVSYAVFAQVQGKVVKYGEAPPFVLEIKGGPALDDNPALRPKLEILACETATVEEKIPLAARVTNVAREELSQYRYKWYNDTERISLGRGLKAFLTPKKIEPMKIRLEAFLLDSLGTEIKVAEATREIKVLPRKPPAPTLNFAWGRSAGDPSAAGQKSAGAAEAARPGIVIRAPAQVSEGDQVEVAVELAPALSAVAKRIKCVLQGAGEAVCEGLRATHFTFWLEPGRGSRPYTTTVVVTVFDKYENARTPDGRWYIDSNVAETVSLVLNVRPNYLTTKLAAGWDGEVGSNGKLKAWVARSTSRKNTKAEGNQNFLSEASLQCSLGFDIISSGASFGKVYDSAAFKDDPVGLEAARCGPYRLTPPIPDLTRGETVTPITVAGMSGYLLESRVTSEAGGPPAMRAYYSVINAGAAWQGWFYTARGGLLLTGQVKARTLGGWDGPDDEKVVPALMALRAEVMNLLAGIKFEAMAVLVAGGPTADSGAGTGGGGMAPLMTEIVSVAPQKVKAGESAQLKAAVSGGKPPYIFKWIGASSAKGDGNAVATPKFPGRHVVSLQVNDAFDNRRYASAAVDVLPQPPALILPAKAKFGDPVPLRARVLPRDGQYRFVWHLGLADPLSTEGSGDSQIDAVFEELGEVPVYVEVLAKDENGQFRSYSDSEKPTVKVEASKFSVAFDPSDAKPGDEVIATVTADPERLQELVRYVWDSPESSNRWIYADSESKIGFKLKQAGAVPLRAVAVLRRNNQVVGEVNSSYAPSIFTVKATVVGPANQGPRPLVWSNSAGGLVPVAASTYGPDESALIRAETDPPTDKVRWRWTANEGTTIQSSELAREIRVTRSGPGTATLKVVAADPDGLQLGFASAAFTVANSAAVAKPAPLAVSLDLGPGELRLGDSVPVRAAVSGGRPPYQFVWHGDHQGEGLLTNFVATRTGRRQLTCEVSDARGNSAKAMAGFTVNARPLQLGFEAAGNLLEEPGKNTVQAMADEIITLTLKAEGGRPPYTAVWSGPVSGQGMTVTCRVPATLKAIVSDALNARGEITITLAQPEGILSGVSRKTRSDAKGQPAAKKPADVVPGKAADKPGTKKPAATGTSPEASYDEAKIEAENKARRLRAEGAALQKEGKLKEAVAKYRESLRYFPDSKMEEHIRKLEEAISP